MCSDQQIKTSRVIYRRQNRNTTVIMMESNCSVGQTIHKKFTTGNKGEAIQNVPNIHKTQHEPTTTTQQ